MQNISGRSSNFAVEDYCNNNIGPEMPAPFATYGSSHNRTGTSHNNNMSHAHRGPLNNNNINSVGSVNKSVTIHQTRDGRHYVSDVSKVACNLCFNKHPKPWHTADNCPFKHPTHIIEKAVRERVMQHNALHGAENKAYTKDQDSPMKPHAPPTSATANSATLCHTEPKVISSPNNYLSEQPPLHTTLLDEIPFTSDDEIVHTEIFQVPVLPTANMGQTPSLHEVFALDELIFDPNHYLSYSS